MTISHVSDTARWVAVYRAMESVRPDALFRDPFAAKLAGEQGERIVDSMKYGRRTAWAMIVRTQVFDEEILDTIRREKVDVVLNIAAGLDARPWRLALDPELRWVDVDFPEILAYKAGIIGDAKPKCHYESRGVDLRIAADRDALFAELGAKAKRVLVIAEGLLIYLTPADVEGLARALAAVPSFGWWIIDLANPILIEFMSKSWGKEVQRGNAPFQFAPAEGTAWFTPMGWKERRVRYNAREARRLKREMQGAAIWRIFGLLMPKKKREAMEQMAATVTFERG
ncbi:class I SAM-dependent methyltransferase [bacterium]|jgi:methyltransferase (TIGR00027 family)|nr:class I SAM-dependent methyltransferase [bacterium]